MLKKIYTKYNYIFHISPKHLFERERFYIIRRHPLGAGFFSNYIYVMSHIMYALEKGYIPVVDMENYRTLYNEKETVNGTKNAWEYYFQQPAGISLEEAYDSHNYILSNYSVHREFIPYFEKDDSYCVDDALMNNASLVVSKYIQPIPQLKTEIDELFFKYFQNNHILGVHYRGTDKHQYNEGHYISPTLEKYVDETKKLLNKYDIDGIFICTDEKIAIDLFTKNFPGKVFYTESYRAEEGQNEGIHLMNDEECKATRKLHKYYLGKEVIIDAYMLSMCDYLIHGHSNVTNASIIIKNNRYIERRLIKIDEN